MSDGHRNWTRRRLVGCGCGWLGVTAVGRTSNSSAAAAKKRSDTKAGKEKILQPLKPSDKVFAQRAFEMRDVAVASGDRSYGALIVNVASLQIVGQSPSRVVTNSDPSAHAEMEAIRDAARRLGETDLSGHAMYSSSRPCPMCEAAAYWANLDLIYFGRSPTNVGTPKLCGGQ